MVDVLRALAYVSWRTNLRRFSGPAPLVLLAALIAGLIVLRSNLGPVEFPQAYARYGIAALVVAAGIGGAFRCPIRLRTADVAWVLPAPRGPRTLVLHSLLATFGGFGLLGLASGGLLTGLSVAFVVTFLRAVFFLSFVLFTHGVPRVAVVGAWIVGAGGVALAGTPDLWVVAVITTVTVAMTVVLADRYHDASARLAWEFAAVRTALEDGAWDSSAITDLTAHRPRRGISSLPAHPRFLGETAFAWRAVAQLRRTWRAEASMILPIFALSIAVAMWAGSRLAALPLALATVVTIGGSGSAGLAEEIDRTTFRTAPGQPGRLVLATELVPVLTSAGTTVAAWLPAAVLCENMGTEFRVGGILGAVGLAALVVTAGSVSAALARTTPARLGLTMIGTGVCTGIAVLAQSLITPGAPVPGWVFALTCMACVPGLHVVAVRLVRHATIAP
jgi:hypothetical protein